MTLRERADRIFSVFVRVSSADYAGFAACFTCGVRAPWKEMQNGHWLRRGFGATRYHEDNCRPQCYSCNEQRGGMAAVFEEALRTDLGDERVDALVQLAHGERQFGDDDYKVVITMYRSILKTKYGIVM